MSARWLGDDAYEPEHPAGDHAVSPRVAACPYVRLQIRVEALDASGVPMGRPVWLSGVGQLQPGDSVGSDTLAVLWRADKRGTYFTVATEEPAP